MEVIRQRLRSGMSAVSAWRILLGLIVLVGLNTAAPLYASVVTIDYSGTVDLSAFGLPSSSTLGGSISWDSAASPFGTFTNSGGSWAEYDGVGTFVLNGTDCSSEVDRTVIRIATGTALFQDFEFAVGFSSYLTPAYIDFINFYPTTLTTTFSSTTLPSDLSFLSGITDGISAFDSPFFGTFARGPVSVTAAPEPASLTLTAFALVSAVALLIFPGTRRSRACGRRGRF